MVRSFGRRGLRRQFDPDVLSRLSLIALGRTAGFSLAEIATIFGNGGRPDLPRDELRAKADELIMTEKQDLRSRVPARRNWIA